MVLGIIIVALGTIMIGLFGYGEYASVKEKRRTAQTRSRGLGKKKGKMKELRAQAIKCVLKLF